MQLTLGTNTDVKLFPSILIRPSRARMSCQKGVVILLRHDDCVGPVRSYRYLDLQILEGADRDESLILIFS